jgi:hypothetical protein
MRMMVTIILVPRGKNLISTIVFLNNRPLLGEVVYRIDVVVKEFLLPLIGKVLVANSRIALIQSRKMQIYMVGRILRVRGSLVFLRMDWGMRVGLRRLNSRLVV